MNKDLRSIGAFERGFDTSIQDPSAALRAKLEIGGGIVYELQGTE